MSRRLLNKNNLGNSTPSLPVENPIELIMNKPKPVLNYVPNEPIILTKEQWEVVCSKTHDATVPFTVTITVKDNENDTLVDSVKDLAIDNEEKEEENYVPKRIRKNKK